MTDDRIQALVSGVLDRVRDQLQVELTHLMDGLQAHTADERAAAAQAARAEAESAAASLASEAIAAERAAFDRQLDVACAEARDRARADARIEERASDLARAEQLLASVRALDAAGSLSEALDALSAGAAGEAGRAAVLLVRGDELRGWAHTGFGDAVDEARHIAIPLADGQLFAAAAASGAPASTAHADGSAGLRPPAPFVLDDPDRIGLAAPLLVDGRVVALVYADDGGTEAREVPSAWPEHVELLARHASRCLEALTARQAVRARGARTAAAGPPALDDDSARRYARLLVSEIKLYHEATVDEGRRAGDLRSRLGSQIARARGLYDQRVPPGAGADFFEQELVRTLAGGDAGLLGRAS